MLNPAPGMAADGHANQANRPTVPSRSATENDRVATAADKFSSLDREDQPKPGPALVDEHGEITIDAYMVGLLDRVRNKTDNLAPRVTIETPAAKKDGPAGPKPDALQSSASSELPTLPQQLPAAQLPAAASPAGQPFQLPRPRRDPLEHLDLDKLRALAQSHAEASIDKHLRQQSSVAAVRQAATVLAALIVGILLAAFSRTTPLVHVPSIMSFAVAIVWALHCAQSMLAMAHQGERSPQLAATTFSAAKRAPLPKKDFLIDA